MEWSEPVTSEPDWVLALVEPFAALVALVDPYLGDALVDRQWPRIQEILDVVPEPATAETANARWREVVGKTWAMLAAAEQRRVTAVKARRR